MTPCHRVSRKPRAGAGAEDKNHIAHFCVPPHGSERSTHHPAIKAADADFAAKYTVQREQRETLRKEELKAMGEILTPEQRGKVRHCFAERMCSCCVSVPLEVIDGGEHH